jgi:hypothetical protein
VTVSNRRVGRRSRPGVAASLLLLTVVLLAAPPALANGGTIRVGNQAAGPYEVTVFTSPTPIQTGSVDVSVAVQKAGASEVVLDAQVAVLVEPVGHEGTARTFPATHEQATNKLFYAANVDLPAAGVWRFTVNVGGSLGAGAVSFEAEASQPGLLGNPALSLTLVPVLLGIWWLWRRRRRVAAN